MDNLIISLISFVGSMIPIVTVLIKLNGTITKLNVTIENLSVQMSDSQSDRKLIHNQLNNHETRITVLENKIERK